jgi:hypothetical protein
MQDRLVAREREVTAFPFGVKFASGSLPRNEFNAIQVHLFSPFVPICLGRPKPRGRHSQAKVTVTEPRAADREGFSEGHAKYFGTLVLRAAVEIRSGRQAGVPA